MHCIFKKIYYKYIGKDNVEATIYKVNKEASIEIAKQLKLRDIGGIIIIDFCLFNNIFWFEIQS